jgi:hypothetical protein
MTTPDDSPRVTRPEPARTAPVRGALQPLPEAPPAPGSPDPGPPTGDRVSESVAHAVRTGYDVVAANIKEGRIAAQRFRQGEYNVRDVPRDLNAMSLRLLHLARDLSATTFEIIEQLLRDPNLPGAATGSRREAAPTPRPAAPVAPAFHPTPAHAAPAAQAVQAVPPHATPAFVALTCQISGSRSAVVKAAQVSRPARPIHPEQMTTAPLTATTDGGRPIGGVSFTPAPGGAGLIAEIPIPDDQPAGVYSGVIFAAGSETPLGFLAIEVLAQAAP